MPGAQITREGSQYVVTCAQHQWRWVAKGGEAHATNLAVKHDREYSHDDPTAPSTLDLTAMAALVVVLHTDPLMSDLAKTTARNLWTCLTGLEGDDALAYARVVAARQTTAVVPPF